MEGCGTRRGVRDMLVQDGKLTILRKVIHNLHANSLEKINDELIIFGLNISEIITKKNDDGFNSFHLAVNNRQTEALDKIYDIIEQLDPTKSTLREMLLDKTNNKMTILHLATSNFMCGPELLNKIADMFAKLDLSPEELKNFLLEKDNNGRNMLHVAMMRYIDSRQMITICYLSQKAQLSTEEFKNDFLLCKDNEGKSGIDYFNKNEGITGFLRSEIIEILEIYFPTSSSGAQAVLPRNY